ncbi:DUF3099 domain-containing protein [Corynebacterium kroppenstedtii]|uniref:DUF3099 domain-containing protein n=1 Tax=Corynebacterium sp. PCR 32 TaxID=3351342 RepID=UPI0030AE6ABB
MFHRRKNVALITDAKRSPVEDWRRRRREYAILQGLRIPFLLFAAVAFMVLHNVILAAVFTVISVPLPWIAVVVANAVGETQDPRQPRVYKPAANRDAYYAFHGALDGERAKQLISHPDDNGEEGLSGSASITIDDSSYDSGLGLTDSDRPRGVPDDSAGSGADGSRGD